MTPIVTMSTKEYDDMKDRIAELEAKDKEVYSKVQELTSQRSALITKQTSWLGTTIVSICFGQDEFDSTHKQLLDEYQANVIKLENIKSMSLFDRIFNWDKS